jgi:hypothetical protein
MVSLP